MPSSPDISKKATLATLAVVAAAVIAASWGYLTDGQAPYGDDNSAHFALMMHIAELWRAGITDLWWNQSNLGLPLFMAYQPLPALVTGSAAALFAETGPRLFLYKATIVGMWAAMPAAWYLGGRWLGLDRKRALVFGLLTLAVHDLHDVGFAATAITYGGLYTQMWGMFFFPMTVGAFRRYVVERDVRLVVPVALFVVVSMSHLFCGMYAGIATLLLALSARGDRLAHLKRAGVVYLPALALMAFWLGPLLATSELIGGLPWLNEYYNGWPAVELFDHVLGGDVLDDGRLPWVTLLAGFGVFLILGRRFGASPEAHRSQTVPGRDADDSPRARRPCYDGCRDFDTWLLALAAVSILLFMGRTNFGSWYNLIPMHADINVMRYINAVQFCGLLFAAQAGGALLEWGHRRLEAVLSADRAGTAALVLAVLAGGFYAVDRAQRFSGTLKTFDQNHPNVRPVIDHLAEGRGQRFAVSDALNTAPHFFRDLFPALAGRAQLQSYALGYHATLSTYYADYIQYDSTAWNRLFNVGGYLAREPYEKGVVDGYTETFRKGPYHVYQPVENPDWGYFDFVRTPMAVHGDFRAIRPGVKSLLAAGFAERMLPTLEGPTELSESAGRPVLRSSDGETIEWLGPKDSSWRRFVVKQAPSKPIASEVLEAARGKTWYRAEVKAAGGAERLLLKANYFPFWHATVDGEPVAVDHVAPNFMAVDVPEGRHTVRFSYHNPWWQKLGAVLSLLVLLGWAGWATRASRGDGRDD